MSSMCRHRGIDSVLFLFRRLAQPKIRCIWKTQLFIYVEIIFSSLANSKNNKLAAPCCLNDVTNLSFSHRCSGPVNKTSVGTNCAALSAGCCQGSKLRLFLFQTLRPDNLNNPLQTSLHTSLWVETNSLSSLGHWLTSLPTHYLRVPVCWNDWQCLIFTLSLSSSRVKIFILVVQ